MFSENFEKESYPAPHRSVRTSKALTVIWILYPCLFLLSLTVNLHTLNNSVIISPFFKSVMNAMKVGTFRHRCSFVTGEERNATNPFVITRREEDASTLARNANSKLLRGVVNILQCKRDHLECTCQAVHSHVRFRRSSHFRNPLGKRETGECC